jgi:tetratricopeptide (TPR) repeat protein
MTKPIDLDSEREKKLRNRIAGGTRDPKDYLQLADIFITQGDYEKAFSVYKQALGISFSGFDEARLSVDLG